MRRLWFFVLFGATATVLFSVTTGAFAIPPYPPAEIAKLAEENPEFAARMRSVFAHQSTTVERPYPALGVVKVPVLLIDFDDHQATTPPSHYESLLFNTAEGAKSMHNYYWENSYGAFDVQGEVTPVWLRSQYLHNGYYVNGDNGFNVSPSAAVGTDYPRNVWGLVKEAVELADPYLDFREFDNDHDGYIDALIVVHAGCGAEFQSCLPAGDNIWSHQSSLGAYLEPVVPRLWPVTTDDGVVANAYTLNPEDGEVGVFSHEYGHTLGLPDLYDTDLLISRVGRFCLMDYGGWSGWPVGSCPSHMCAWSKSFLGWIDPHAIDSATDPDSEPWQVTFAAFEFSAFAYRVLDNPGGMDWTVSDPTGSGEYFLVENRQLVGYDSQLFQPTGPDGEGLLILHVDESERDNNGPSRFLASVVQADGGTVEQMGTGEAADLWVPGREFTPHTDPSSDLYSGESSGVYVTQITSVGGDRISALLARRETPEVPGSGPVWEIQVAPNPFVVTQDDSKAEIRFGSYPSEEGGGQVDPLRVWIYDLSGSLVRFLEYDQDAPYGVNQAVWDGRNEDGERVAAGVYFLYADNGWKQASGRIAVVR